MSTVLFFSFPTADPIHNIQRYWEIYSVPLHIHMITTMAFTAMCMYSGTVFGCDSEPYF